MLARAPVDRLSEFSLGLNVPNQDSVLTLSVGPHRSVVAVADGVGGSPRGDLASGIAIDSLRDDLTERFDLPIEELFDRAATSISEKLPTLEVATTLTIVRCDGYEFEVGHVGDTRAYHLREYGVIDLTVDQNEGRVLVEQGVFSKRDIHKYPRRNVLTSALNSRKTYDLFKGRGSARVGDRILVVSDGVHDLLARREIAEINLTSRTVDAFMNALRDNLISRGLRDDSSAACVEFGAE